MNDCHSQAVRGSRASSLSEKRRNSPARGDSTSPTLEPFPGKSTPFNRVCTRTHLVNTATNHERARLTDLDEELRVKRARGRVERRARDCRVDMVLRRDRVRDEEVDDLVRAEARVAHACDDRVGAVGRLGHEQVGRRLRHVVAACEELQARAPSAVRHADGAGELDAVV